jgi:hypothetical protein
VLVFTQNFGGTLMLSFAELIFTQSLERKMKIYAPETSAADILAWGATGFRDYVLKEDLPDVLLAYDKAITNTLYLGLGTMVMAWCFTWGLGWKSIKAKKEKDALAEEGTVEEA